MMRVTLRWILVCALVPLQLASASGHMAHHAFDSASPEHDDCGDTPCAMNRDSTSTCPNSSDEDSPYQHDCNDCFLCDASDAQAARVTPAQRPLEGAAAVWPPAGAVEFASSGDSSWRLPHEPPPPHPATLNAVTLPLLD